LRLDQLGLVGRERQVDVVPVLVHQFVGVAEIGRRVRIGRRLAIVLEAGMREWILMSSGQVAARTNAVLSLLAVGDAGDPGVVVRIELEQFDRPRPRARASSGAHATAATIMWPAACQAWRARGNENENGGQQQAAQISTCA
jgi:hypothetical protein